MSRESQVLETESVCLASLCSHRAEAELQSLVSFAPGTNKDRHTNYMYIRYIY